MQYYNVGRYLGFLQQRLQQLEVELGRIQQLKQRTLQSRTGLQQGLSAVEQDLMQTLLPDLRENLLQPLGDFLEFPYLKSGLIQRMVEVKQALVSRKAAIEADPRFIDRVSLFHSESGTVVRRIRELTDHCNALQPALDRCAHPRLQALLDSGYGTSKDNGSFWNTDHRADGKAAEEIVQRFPEGTTFETVRAEYLEAVASMAVLRSGLEEARAEYEAGVALEREHAEVDERLRTLKDQCLADVRARIIRFLWETPAARVRLESRPELVSMTRRLVGLAHKLEYLDGMARLKLEPMARAVMEDGTACQRDFAELQKPEHERDRFPEDQVQRRFVGRHESAMRNMDTFEAQMQTICAFDRYDLGRVTPDFLWWDLMTGGRWAGAYLPQVAEFRRTHPDWRFVPADSTST